MSEDFRSKAEEFVTEFLNYVHKYDILDEFDKRTQKMTRSAGVQALVTQAEKVFPPRKPETAGEEMKTLSDEQRDASIKASSNVLDTREQFAKRIASNGGTRRLLRQVLDGNPDAIKQAEEFFLAEDGKKEFHVSPKV